MDVELTIKNYRCFPDSRPARIVVRDGFTAFLGVNNSGKSTLLKFFYELRGMFNTLSVANQSLADALRGMPQTFNPPPAIGELEDLFCKDNNRNLVIELKLLGEEDNRAQPVPQQYTVTIPRASNTFTLDTVFTKDIQYKGRLDFLGTLLRFDGSPRADFGPFVEYCRDLASTVYIGPFRNAINIGTKQSYFDIDVGQAFISAWQYFKTGPSHKQNEAIYKLTQDISRIFDFRDLEINASPDGQNLKFLVNGRSYFLAELGSGLAQFVLVLANAATKKPAFILIDEPELNLHPSLQLDFLTTLGSYARRGVLFATHSYGLARARAQLVYTLRPDPDGGSEVKPLESTPRLSELLGELSFSAYRELGFDKILLVEGITEVLTVQQFLRLYNKDHKVVPLPMGGDSFINGDRELELEEIMRITKNVYALIDSERASVVAPLPKNRQEFESVCQRVGINCCVLKRRAMENYLTEAAVKAIRGGKYRALKEYELLKDANPSWSKNDNWRIARMMTKPDLASTDLGPFFDSL
jgi:ABC-type cobalamin/Fe3+-siderophores transport system ATPase subunit